MTSTTPKQAARSLIERLEEDASFEDIQYNLYVLQQVERGLHDVETGNTVSHEEAKAALAPWLDRREARG